MMFSSIGTIQSHIKSMDLQFKWQQKQKNPQTLTSHESTGSGQTQKSSKYNAFSLEQKLKMGQKLTADEMKYLRGNYPDLYSQAVNAENERQSYKSMLGDCKTKDDVTRANMQRVAALHDELTSVQSNPNLSQGEKFKQSVGIHMKAQAVSDEHGEFQRSSEYQKLPTEQELRDKEKAAQKQKEKEFEKSKAKETEPKEESTPQVDDHVGETSEPQVVDGETGNLAEHPVSEPEAPQPSPESVAIQTTPEPVMPESAAPQPQTTSYTRDGYASPNISHGYAQARSATPGGNINVGV